MTAFPAPKIDWLKSGSNKVSKLNATEHNNIQSNICSVLQMNLPAKTQSSITISQFMINSLKWMISKVVWERCIEH